MSGSMQSNVGNSQIYEDGDQRTEGRNDEGSATHDSRTWTVQHQHDPFDPRDDRTLNNKVKDEKQLREAQDEQRQTVTDPLEPAKRQGHEPSRGAHIDEELKHDDEETLKKKGRA